jgi:hypothetical protein
VSGPDSDRARAKIEREVRVDRVLSLMSRGAWFGVRTTRELATEWSCSQGAVNDYAREASGIIRHVLSDDVEELRAQLLLGAEDIRRRALRKSGGSDLRSALGALELRAKVLGLVVQRIDAKVTTSAPRTPAEAQAQLEAMLEAVTPEDNE